ncbi:MAG: hypothetical protein Q8K76_01605, partial [Rhodoferax sp.]|nr:hypothetical protein [Rhodoferax sp.]
RQDEARLDADVGRLHAVTDLKRRFLAEHLGRWIGPFAQAVQAGAQSVFYAKLAELTELFVRAEAHREGVPVLSPTPTQS